MDMPNYFDQNPNAEDEENFKDQPPEMTGEEPAEVQVTQAPVPRPQRPTTATVQLPQGGPEQDPQYEEEQLPEESEDSDDFSNILVDARLRLEQGRLYEMIMNHDIFQGADADPKAVKFVQKQIRNFAKEQMEIMLGMRKETAVIEQLEIDFPFNALEVDTLRALARAATKGASDNSDRYVPSVTRTTSEVDVVGRPAKTTINPIGGASKRAPRPAPVQPRQQKQENKPLAPRPPAPVKRASPSAAIQRILEEEGVTLAEINQVFDPNKKYLTPEELSMLTDDQVIERNRQIKNRQVSNPGAVPMPTMEQMESAYLARANQAAAHPQMQKIMGLLDEAHKKKGL